jgi:hypothetical protein
LGVVIVRCSATIGQNIGLDAFNQLRILHRQYIFSN